MEKREGKCYYTSSEVAADLGITLQGWYRIMNSIIKDNPEYSDEAHPNYNGYIITAETKKDSKGNEQKKRLFSEDMFEAENLPVGKRSQKYKLDTITKELERALFELEEERKKAMALVSENEGIRQQLAKALSDVEQLNIQRKELSDKVNEQAQLIQVLKSDAEDKDKKCEMLRQELSSVQSDAAENEQLRSTNKALTDKVNDLEQLITQMKADADTKAAEYEKLKEEVITLRERTANQEKQIQSQKADLNKQSDNVNRLTAAVGILTANKTKVETAFRSLSATPLMSRLFGWNAAVQTAALLTDDIIQSDAVSDDKPE